MSTEDQQDGPGPAYASVWDAIEDTPAEAAHMRMRSELMMALKDARPRLPDAKRCERIRVIFRIKASVGCCVGGIKRGPVVHGVRCGRAATQLRGQPLDREGAGWREKQE